MPEYKVSTSFTSDEADPEEAARNFAKDASDIYADGELLVTVVDESTQETSQWRTGPKGLRRVEDENTI